MVQSRAVCSILLLLWSIWSVVVQYSGAEQYASIAAASAAQRSERMCSAARGICPRCLWCQEDELDTFSELKRSQLQMLQSCELLRGMHAAAVTEREVKCCASFTLSSTTQRRQLLLYFV